MDTVIINIIVVIKIIIITLVIVINNTTIVKINFRNHLSNKVILL